MLAGAHKKFYRIQHAEIHLLDLKVQYKHKMKLPLDMVYMYFCTSASLINYFANVLHKIISRSAARKKSVKLVLQGKI